jgi:hypothetical protein
VAVEEPLGAIGVVDAEEEVGGRAQLVALDGRAPAGERRRLPAQHAPPARRVDEQRGLDAGRPGRGAHRRDPSVERDDPTVPQLHGEIRRMLEQRGAGAGGQVPQPAAEPGHVGGDHGRVRHRDAAGAVGTEEVHDPTAVDALGRHRRFQTGPRELPVEHAVVPLRSTGVQGALLDQDDGATEPGELVRRVGAGRARAHDGDVGPDHVAWHPATLVRPVGRPAQGSSMR